MSEHPASPDHDIKRQVNSNANIGNLFWRGSLSEASRVFDPALLRQIIGDLARQALPLAQGREAEALRGLTAVDGTVLAA
ncbi:MAG TPA: hypothetical protein DDY78_19720, partial [Planctomycetales bacterium]|nr:hypothetical protein [Planctomycetales bacterium]